MSVEINLAELQKSDLAVVGDTSGFSVNLENSRLNLFTKSTAKRGDLTWKTHHLELPALRQVNNVETQPMTFDTFGRQGVGSIIGQHFREKYERKIARQQTGLSLDLSSMDFPSFFVSVPVQRDREVILEGLRQIIDHGTLERRFHVLPKSLKDGGPRKPQVNSNALTDVLLSNPKPLVLSSVGLVCAYFALRLFGLPI